MSIGSHLSNHKKAVFWNLLMLVLMLGGAVLVPYLREGGQALRPIYLVLSAVLALGAALYACFFEAKTADGVLFWLIPLVYVISIAFLLLFDKPFTFPFWIFGGLLILCAFRLRYGMFLNLFLLFIIGSLQTELLSEVLIMQALCLVLFGFVMPHARSWKDGVNVLISVVALLISVRIVCYITMEKGALTNDIFCVALVYAIVICATLLLSNALRDTVLLQEQNEGFDFLEELAAGTEEQDADVSEYMALAGVAAGQTDDSVFGSTFVPEQMFNFEEKVAEQRALLESLCDESSPLLTVFSQKFPKAFLHARRVALIASEIAESTENINVLLVKCGGYYHEIGRLRGAKSIENTLAIAKEEDFPAMLQNVLREHTVDGDKPTSKEAALVLLTDNICSMCEHLRKTQTGNILVGKVIDKALNLRLSKGDLNQSGLTAKDLSAIRNAMVEVIKEDMF